MYCFYNTSIVKYNKMYVHYKRGYCYERGYVMIKLAIIGSSGGNLYNLGGKEPKKLLGEIVTQAKSANIEISMIEFIGAKASMDNVKETTEANLFIWDNDEITMLETKKLKDINKDAIELDKEIANKIQNGEIDGLILMSCDPNGINKESINAAINKKIPIVGTGGTSMATISSKGGNVIATSGTTGTTNRTRAIASMTSLCKHFKIKYRPIVGGNNSSASNSGSLKERISFRGIMMAALPGFISMALVLALSKIPAFSSLSAVFDVIITALPIIVATIAAKQVSGLDEIGIVAGVVAGALSTNGGLIGGILGGILAGILADYIMRKCLEWRIPGTTANIFAGGLAGLLAGLFVYFIIAPIALYLGNGIRTVIEAAISFSPILAGAVAGLLIWPAIMGGVYHAAILPVVLLEMEATGMSFLGAIDMVGLVMGSAGITLANIIYPRKPNDKAIAIPGFLINMGFGTFVEAAYPFMFSSKLVMAGALVASTLGGISVGIFDLRGTAYVPSLAAPGLSNHPLGFLISMLVGMAAAFIFTLIANKSSRRKDNKNTTNEGEVTL